MIDTEPRTRADDFEAIRNLKARYFRFLDTKDWGGFKSLFAVDAQIGPIDSGFPDYLMALRPADAQKPVQSSGLDAFVERVAANIGPLITTHHGHTHEIEFASEDEASGIWAMEDVLVWPEHGYRLRGTGHYHHTYRRVDGNWKFSSLKLTRLYVYVEKCDVSTAAE
jgi:hypothetical protein